MSYHGLSSHVDFPPQHVTDQTDMQKVHELVFDTDKGSETCSILRHDYFRRRWVIQEATLACDVFLHCGCHGLSW